MNKKSTSPLYLGIVLCILLCQALFSSCLKSKSTEPAFVSFYKDTVACFPGDSILFFYNASTKQFYAEPNTYITSAWEELYYNGHPIMAKKFALKTGLMPYLTDYFKYKIPDTCSGQMFAKVTVFCDNHTSSTAYMAIFLTYKGVGTEVGGQDSPDRNGFFNANNGMNVLINSSASNSADVDMCYFYDTIQKACIASADDPALNHISFTGTGTNVADWPHRNHTVFRTSPVIKSYSDFKQKLMVKNGLKELFDNASNETTMLSQVTNDRFYLFHLASGKYGVLSFLPRHPGPTGEAVITLFIQP